MLSLLVIIVLSYLVGSIPTSIIVSKLFYGKDIRDYGSGNAGGTNVFRVLGWKPGVLVMAVDVGKGVVATLVVSSIRIDPIPVDAVLVQILAGLMAVFGHIWTAFAGFRGGKGVGTAAGMLISLYPIAALICAAIFGIVAFTTRIVAVGSMSAAVSLPVVLLILEHFSGYNVPDALFIFSLLIAALIIFTHRSNIRRLINGTENRFKRRQAPQ